MSASAWRLECHSVTRFFGETAVLREVGFEVEAGKLIALYGANGAGKSTLLRILAGGLKPSRGEARVGGFAVGSAAARRQTGLLSHRSFLHPTLTVRENLDFYAAMFEVRSPASAIASALERVRGEELATRRAGELSQGMRQKAALARCLLHCPRLLLLDEPFASLDIATVTEMRVCFAGLRDQGLTLVVSSHNEVQVNDLSDGSLTLDRGRLRAAHGAAHEGAAHG